MSFEIIINAKELRGTIFCDKETKEIIRQYRTEIEKKTNSNLIFQDENVVDGNIRPVQKD